MKDTCISISVLRNFRIGNPCFVVVLINAKSKAASNFSSLASMNLPSTSISIFPLSTVWYAVRISVSDIAKHVPHAVCVTDEISQEALILVADMSVARAEHDRRRRHRVFMQSLYRT